LWTPQLSALFGSLQTIARKMATPVVERKREAPEFSEKFSPCALTPSVFSSKKHQGLAGNIEKCVNDRQASRLYKETKNEVR